TTPIGDGSRFRTRTLRANGNQTKLDGCDAAATCPNLQQLDGGNVERQPTTFAIADLIDLERRHNRWYAIIDRPKLGSRPTHIKCQNVIAAFLPSHLRTHEDAGRRAGLDDAHWVLDGEIRWNQTAIRLHDEELSTDPALPER